jgi:hypothetical protein
MKSAILNNGYGLFEPPRNSMLFRVVNNRLEYVYMETVILEPLPKGNWEFICEAKDATEEQAKGIVGNGTHIRQGVYLWPDFEDKKKSYKRTALESLHSLIISKGMEVSQTIILFNNDKK